MGKVVSFDIGGTAIKYGLIEDGVILEKGKVDTDAEKGGPAILQKTLDITEEYLGKYSDIDGVGVSTAGMVDIEAGSIFYASTIPGYTGINFKKTFREKLDLPCEVENDVNCAGLAEYISGASKGSSIAVMLTIGTGIGGSAIIDGKVFHGFSNSACEVGYIQIDGEDFQTLGAASILTGKVAQQKHDSREHWNGIRIFDEARNGDEICIHAIDKMVEVLGKGIASICCVLNPEVVVLGGGIMAEVEYLEKRIRDSVNKYLVSGIAEHTTIKFAQHRNDAGILGAYYNFCQCNE